MYLKQFLEQYKDKNIKIFVDMDGTIADYDIGIAKDYDKKRPLFDSIKKLEEIAKLNNIELYILSVTRKNEGCKEKNYWLDKYASFFLESNRVIISREDNDMISSAILKANYLKSVKRDDNTVIIAIDDDPKVLKEMIKENEDIILLKDTALVD